MIRRIPSIFIICILIGCHFKSSLEVNHGIDGLILFNGTIKPTILKSNKIALEDFRLPTRIKQINDYLFITDLKRDAGMVCIYDLNNQKYLKSIIPKGSGPFELSAISSIVSGNSGTIYFYDVQSLRLLEANLDFLLQNDLTQPVYSNRLIFENFEKAFRIVNVSDTIYLAYTLPGIKGRFMLLNSKFESTGIQFANYPPIERKPETYDMTEVSFNAKVLGNLYTCAITTHPSADLLVVAHHHVDIIEIYKITEQKRLLRIVGPDQNFPPDYIINKSGQGLPCRECRCGYASPQVFTNYIAVLRLNKLYTDADAYISKYIYFFDWEGTLQKVIELDAEVSEFVIDEGRRKIYAIAFDQDEALLEYDLPSEFENGF
ncbi:MAG: hypothetical protein KF856_11895 [Cyclobacteriaceae bacterium]|nr:hypothetical protein [Cyclobacteriaceae bacterium]